MSTPATRSDLILILVFIFVNFLTLTIFISRKFNEVRPKPIQVYYEYDVYNTAVDGRIISDTIPCDTTFLAN